MASIKRKQFKPKKLLTNLQNNILNQFNIGSEMQDYNSQPLDLSKKELIEETLKKENSENDELLDLSKKPLIVKSDFLNSSICHENPSPVKIEISVNDKPLDLRISSKKNELDRFYDNMKKIYDENSTEFKNIKSSLTKLVRGQDEWMNNSRNNFISQILKCLVCAKSFETLNELSSHMLESKHFNKMPTTQMHTTVAEPASTVINESSNKILNKGVTTLYRKNLKLSKSSQQQTNSNKSTSNVLLCLICKKTFSNGSSLVEHLQNNHTINQICTSCGAYFETSSAYNQHLIDEDYHHHSHHRSKQILISQSSKLRNIKRELDENEKKISIKKIIKTNLDATISSEKGKLEAKEDEFNNNNNKSLLLKNPLSALELFVSNNEINSVNADKKKKCNENNMPKLVENPLNLLQKMHSNFNNYVF